MNSLWAHPWRVAGRLLWLAGEIILGLGAYLPVCTFRPPAEQLHARARWLQRACRRTLRIFRTDLEISGPIPANGFMVCNHLSYLDILVIGACTPAVFVAKREVQGWPVFGWFARLAGTVFVHRESRTHVGQVADAMAAALARGALVVLFPEGTSSNGQTVLPFRSSLLEPAARLAQPVTAAWIGYELADGDVGEEVCYWKDMTLLPHLLNLLGKRQVRARLRFQRVPAPAAERKELARQLHAEVVRLKESP